MTAKEFVQRLECDGGKLTVGKLPSGQYNLYVTLPQCYNAGQRTRVTLWASRHERDIYAFLHNRMCENDPEIDEMYGKRSRYEGDARPVDVPFSLREDWLHDARRRLRRYKPMLT